MKFAVLFVHQLRRMSRRGFYFPHAVPNVLKKYLKHLFEEFLDHPVPEMGAVPYVEGGVQSGLFFRNERAWAESHIERPSPEPEAAHTSVEATSDAVADEMAS